METITVRRLGGLEKKLQVLHVLYVDFSLCVLCAFV